MEKKITKKLGRPRKLSNKKESAKEKVSDFSSLTLTDVMCPICLSIMIEPVTMPCKHSLCMPCFLLNVAEAALACPMCRKRISIWVRKNTKTKELVNLPLWQWIKDNFQEKVEIRLQGKDDPEDSFLMESPLPRVCAPGEIQQEYKAQLRQIQEEEELNRKKEENASEVTILTLQEEEKKELERIELEKSLLCSKDLELAKQLQESDRKNNLKFGMSRNSKNISVSNLNLSPIVGSTMKQGSLDIYLSQNTPNLSKKFHKLIKHSTPFGEGCSSKTDKEAEIFRKCDSKCPDVLRITTTDSLSKCSEENVTSCSLVKICSETPETSTANKCKSPSVSPEYPLFEPPLLLNCKPVKSSNSTNNHTQNNLSEKSPQSLRHLKDITASYSSESEMENDSDSENFKIRQKFRKSNKENATRGKKLFSNCKSEDSIGDLDAEVNRTFSNNGKLNISTSQESIRGISATSSMGNLHLSLSTDNDTSLGQSHIAANLLVEGAVVDENAMAQLIEEQKAIERKFQQIKQDRLFALRLEKDMKKVDRSKGSEDQYSLRNSFQNELKGTSTAFTSTTSFTSSSSPNRGKTQTNSRSTKTNKVMKRSLSDKLRQTTLIETISKRQKRL